MGSAHSSSVNSCSCDSGCESDDNRICGGAGGVNYQANSVSVSLKPPLPQASKIATPINDSSSSLSLPRAPLWSLSPHALVLLKGTFFLSPAVTTCEGGDVPRSQSPPSLAGLPPPPKMVKAETFEEKLYRKVTQQPLIPLGCIATAYFLASGIRSFRDNNPVKSQRMMKARVMAQFATLMCFVAYAGYDQFDYRFAPMYQEALKRKKLEEEEQRKEGASVSVPANAAGKK